MKNVWKFFFLFFKRPNDDKNIIPRYLWAAWWWWSRALFAGDLQLCTKHRKHKVGAGVAEALIMVPAVSKKWLPWFQANCSPKLNIIRLTPCNVCLWLESRSCSYLLHQLCYAESWRSRVRIDLWLCRYLTLWCRYRIVNKVATAVRMVLTFYWD